jgi:hypothetical protein
MRLPPRPGGKLPAHHRDPFDRLLIGKASRNRQRSIPRITASFRVVRRLTAMVALFRRYSYLFPAQRAMPTTRRCAVGR